MKNENCNMGIMFRFVAKGSDIDENYVNTSISNNEGGKKWRYIHQSSLKKKTIERFSGVDGNFGI